MGTAHPDRSITPINRYRLILTGLFLFAAFTASAQNRRTGRPDVSTTQPTGGKVDRKELGRMVLDRPEVPVSRPLGADGQKKSRPVLPTDGSYMVDRLCRIHRDAGSGWVLVVPIDEADDSPSALRWALPNRLLEKLEQIAAEKPETIFRLTGENATYDKRAFVLIQRASIVPEAPEVQPDPLPVTQPSATSQPASQPTTAPATQASQPATAPVATTQPATSQPATAPVATTQPATAPVTLPDGPSPEELIRRLRRDRPGKPVLEGTPKRGPRPNQPAVAPGAREKTIDSRRGKFIVNRTVTVVPAKTGRWMQVRFMSDNNLQEPPMKLLPCRMLHVAELLVASMRKGHTVRLRISGMITFYKGRRFLLLRKTVIERPLDRF